MKVLKCTVILALVGVAFAYRYFSVPPRAGNITKISSRILRTNPSGDLIRVRLIVNGKPTLIACVVRTHRHPCKSDGIYFSVDAGDQLSVRSTKIKDFRRKKNGLVTSL